jgi:hypothetical protein
MRSTTKSRSLPTVNISRWLKSERHRQLIERWWIAIVLVWDILKTVVVDEKFAKYGVNPYIYFIIVITIAVPYAISTAKMLFAIIANQWRGALSYGAIAVTLHFIPDIYILATARQVPRSLFDSFVVMIVIFTVFAVHGITSKVRTHRRSTRN